MDSSAMIYIPSFIKNGSGIEELMGWDTQTGRRPHKLKIIFLRTSFRCRRETALSENSVLFRITVFIST
jgi:hypothetical protein